MRYRPEEMMFCSPARRTGVPDRPWRSWLFLLVGLSVLGCQPAGESDGGTGQPAADAPVTLVDNAKIYTFDRGGTVIESGALAFSADGEILAIGDSEAMRTAFATAQRIDLAGKALLPGLIDSHGHLYGLALSLTQADLVGASSKSEVIDRLRQFAADLPPGDWLLGRGWDQNDWPDTTFPDHMDLDAVFPDRPVWLRRIDGHAAWGNSLAMAQADQDLTGNWQPPGGLVQRKPDGAPTGIFVDSAMELVDRAVPPPSAALVDAALDLATQNLVSLGLTGVHDPGIDRSVAELYLHKIASGSMPLRIYAMADGAGDTLDWLCANGPLADPSGRLIMRSVKLYADGALGSRGAALSADYADEAGNRGLLFASNEALAGQMRHAMSCGLQVSVHAIGDRANRQVLDVFEQLLPEYPANPGRHRIEHAQILDPADIPRFAGLGIIAAMQPTHATSDMYWAGERLGPQRLAGAYAWKSLLESGAVLAFGSDFPVEEVNPMLGIHAAVTRQDAAGWPKGGWLPQQRLARVDAVRAFTLDAAFAAFMEQTVGSIEVGKRADFIVLNRDPMTVPAADFRGLQVLQTWVDGQRVFQRASEPKAGAGKPDSLDVDRPHN